MNHEQIRAQLEIYLRRVARRLCLVESARWGLLSLAGALALALVMAVLARLVPLVPTAVLVPVALVLALTGVFAGLVIVWLRPRPLFAVARLADCQSGLQARLATAWAIVEGKLSVEEPMAYAQLADALRAAEKLDPRVTFPLRLPRLEAVAVLILALVLVLALLLPNPQDAVLAHRAAVREVVAEQIAELEELRAELEQVERLAETEAGRQVLAELEELERALTESTLTQEEAVAALSEAEAGLRRVQDASAAARQAAMREAGRRAGQTANTNVNQALAQALVQGDADQAAAILAGLAGEEGEALTREEELALADALEQVSEALAASDPDLAESLAQAAQEIRDRDIAAARQTLAQASGQMAQAGQEMRAQQAASQAAERVQQSRQVVAGVGQEGQSGQAAQSGQGSQGGQSGQSGQQGQGGQGGQGQQGGGEGSGQGASSGSGQEGTGGGSGRGDPGQPGEGGATGGQMPIDNGPNQGLERNYEPIYAPQFLDGEGGEQVDLPGSDESGEEIRMVPGQGGVPGEAQVPYNAVYATYRDAAAEALDDSLIPLGMKEVVRQYFSSLEP